MYYCSLCFLTAHAPDITLYSGHQIGHIRLQLEFVYFIELKTDNIQQIDL